MRLSAIGGSRYKYLIDVNFSSTFASYNNQTIYTIRVSAFSFYSKKKTPAKEKQNRGNPPLYPRNAAPQYTARGSQLAARHIRPQTRRSLNGCELVRLASQAVQPSQNIVAYRPWSGRYAPCFSPTSPRFIRHRRRFGDVARSSKKAVKHCDEAMESLTIKDNRVARFYFEWGA